MKSLKPDNNMEFTLEELKNIRIAVKYYGNRAKLNEEQVKDLPKLYRKIKYMIAGKLPEQA